ncbi:VOC family protein [Tepidibacter hydrothermalis]|uniref:Glyoxalase/bleomycin resistance/dioxygenase family protein n=1 Tax=Tepidibacter hydrothermalis TaxID=3036126 RepID=A0ABY8EEW4_9FIRM|nr:VOC family protein [Tepidibacter hydrothermalis]WFD11477.1 glyoxalase/bleomycin resistance/dioxygenase family protein [Tepidibacter hydrothermalis]
MKFKCPLIVVADIDVARNFYENVLNQKVKYDFGENIMYEGDFAIQLKSHFANRITINESDISTKSNNFELYFEEENIDDFIEKLKNINQIQYIHRLIEHSWGQRVIRFYDPDMNIIEVGETMESVVKRFLNQGLSPEETAKRTQYPIEFVKQCL